MGWSISPDTGLASIDQNGVLTYQQHTSDQTYTISYSDDDCTKDKSVTIYACTPCSCTDFTVTGKTDISKDSGDNVTIGTFSKASCMSNPRASSSTSWLSNLSVSGNDIKATVEANSESSSRNGSVTVTVDKDGGGTCDKTMSITQSAGGGGPTKHVEIKYTVQFKNIEKGSVDVTLKVPNENINISVTSAGGTSTSGKTTGKAKFDVDSSWTDEQIVNAIDFDIPNMVATLGHETVNYKMRWNGSCLSCDISDSQCPAFNPWPQICGPCKVCASIDYDIRINNIIMTVTGGQCEI